MKKILILSDAAIVTTFIILLPIFYAYDIKLGIGILTPLTWGYCAGRIAAELRKQISIYVKNKNESSKS